MRLHTLLLLCAALLLLSGCAAPKKDFSAFYAHQPRSIVVVPVVNESTEVTAPTVFMSTITTPLAERGYYVFPVYLTGLLLQDIGLPEAGLVHQLPPQRFYDLFGADAVLFITIKDWSTKYLVIQSSVVVDMAYVLKDTRTGMVLWESRQPIVHSSGGGGNLIAMAVNAAIHALVTDYRPLAQQANNTVFWGLPAGARHPQYQNPMKDRAMSPENGKPLAEIAAPTGQPIPLASPGQTALTKDKQVPTEGNILVAQTAAPGHLPSAPASPETTSEAASKPSGTMAYEAEAAAMRLGCVSAGGGRPSPSLLSVSTSEERYQITCANGILYIQCESGRCHKE